MSIFIDVSILPQDFNGFVQVCTLGAIYGYGLFYAANLISDGSELLLLVPSMAGLVGSVILPILGAVPDGMMVLFSGLGDNAQEEIGVGVGALAGSTIMLLTVPWFMSILAGRVNIDENGQCIYKGKNKLPTDSITEYKLWKNTGVKLSPEISKAAHIMIMTMGSYAIIQLPALFHIGAPVVEQAVKLRPWALLATFCCIVAFGLYLYYSYRLSTEPAGEENEIGAIRNVVREEYMIKAIAAGKISLVGVMQAEFEHYQSFPSMKSFSNNQTKSGINSNDEATNRLRRVIEPFFAKYDNDNSGFLDIEELGRVFSDMGENVSHKSLISLYKTMDNDGDGSISIDEFCVGVMQYISNNSYLLKKSSPQGEASTKPAFQRIDDSETGKAEEEEEEEEDDEMPEDLVDLPPYEQQRRIKIRALFLTLFGTAIVLLLSDPMVGVLADIGKRTGIAPFYISFIFAPIASNASEVIASFAYAAKKTSQSITISLTQLEGAAIMNNTFVLGIFTLMIYKQSLMWEFLAESLSIIFVQCALAYFALKKVNTLRDGFLILALYPASLLIVAFLELIGVP